MSSRGPASVWLPPLLLQELVGGWRGGGAMLNAVMKNEKLHHIFVGAYTEGTYIFNTLFTKT
jgi:hypothetical protein